MLHINQEDQSRRAAHVPKEWTQVEFELKVCIDGGYFIEHVVLCRKLLLHTSVPEESWDEKEDFQLWLTEELLTFSQTDVE